MGLFVLYQEAIGKVCALASTFIYLWTSGLYFFLFVPSSPEMTWEDETEFWSKREKLSVTSLYHSLLVCLPQLMCDIARMMCECWSHQPSARLTILRVKKNLHRKLKVMGHNASRGGKFTGGEKKLIHCNSSGSSSFLCKYSTAECGGRDMGRAGRVRGGYSYGVKGGGSSGGESSSGVSGVSGGISETYSGRM